jgi:hypothetical protein
MPHRRSSSTGAATSAQPTPRPCSKHYGRREIATTGRYRSDKVRSPHARSGLLIDLVEVPAARTPRVRGSVILGAAGRWRSQQVGRGRAGGEAVAQHGGRYRAAEAPRRRPGPVVMLRTLSCSPTRAPKPVATISPSCSARQAVKPGASRTAAAETCSRAGGTSNPGGQCGEVVLGLSSVDGPDRDGAGVGQPGLPGPANHDGARSHAMSPNSAASSVSSV